jgi:hypothetical protein
MVTLVLVAVGLAVNLFMLYCLHAVMEQAVALHKIVTSTEETAIDLHKMVVETHALMTNLNHDLRES